MSYSLLLSISSYRMRSIPHSAQSAFIFQTNRKSEWGIWYVWCGCKCPHSRTFQGAFQTHSVWHGLCERMIFSIRNRIYWLIKPANIGYHELIKVKITLDSWVVCHFKHNTRVTSDLQEASMSVGTHFVQKFHFHSLGRCDMIRI